jgi:hypothetical protein
VVSIIIKINSKEEIKEPVTLIAEYSGRETKIALLSRIILGLDELTDKRIRLYSSAKEYKKVAGYSFEQMLAESKYRS